MRKPTAFFTQKQLKKTQIESNTMMNEKQKSILKKNMGHTQTKAVTFAPKAVLDDNEKNKERGTIWKRRISQSVKQKKQNRRIDRLRQQQQRQESKMVDPEKQNKGLEFLEFLVQEDHDVLDNPRLRDALKLFLSSPTIVELVESGRTSDDESLLRTLARLYNDCQHQWKQDVDAIFFLRQARENAIRLGLYEPQADDTSQTTGLSTVHSHDNAFNLEPIEISLRLFSEQEINLGKMVIGRTTKHKVVRHRMYAMDRRENELSGNPHLVPGLDDHDETSSNNIVLLARELREKARAYLEECISNPRYETIPVIVNKFNTFLEILDSAENGRTCWVSIRAYFSQIVANNTTGTEWFISDGNVITSANSSAT